MSAPLSTIVQSLRELQSRWSAAKAAERANAQLFLTELCDALGVERPRPAGSGYEFEFPVKVVNRDGSETTNFIDLYKRDHFVLEAKDEEGEKSSAVLMRKAFGQGRTYASAVDGAPPPYLLVLDVGKVLLVWDRWSGSYGGFNAARRISLATLADSPDDIALLRDIFENPTGRDPRGHAAAVTREVAGKLATLASALESRGHEPERVARFLIRCVFTAFAEDVGLLPDQPFETAIREIGFRDPEDFGLALEELWQAMEEGKRFGLRKLLRFNGHFFRDARSLPLTREDLVILHEAARADWKDVEPSIFGTLLTRALDPVERHRLGAEYTPREFVERLVRPTVEEPIRERWTAVQAEVLQLLDPEGKGERKRRETRQTALERLREFHTWLRTLRFLDPACGSGNFLYVTMLIVKRIELEVLRLIEEITGHRELAVEEVGPWQFYGIEVKPWARELAELVLWIGYHQFWRLTHGHALPPEPILKDTGTLELRDAVLAWNEIVHRPEKDRPDPTPRILHPVTGKLVPDPEARLPYYEYVGARQAEWPQADFIVGNPPYLGNKRMREVFGDGYVDALRASYPEVPDSADLVMYWWSRAADDVALARTISAGLITTNTITQTYNRAVIQRAVGAGAQVSWAIPDHPWVEDAAGAAVRVAMTILSKDPSSATRITVDANGEVQRRDTVLRLNTDLSAHADVASASAAPLRAARGISSVGFWLVGDGFRIDPDEGQRLRALDINHIEIVRPIYNGRDLTARPRGIYAIDFGNRSHDAAAQMPVLYNLLVDRVKPQRQANNDRSAREKWWRFGRNREDLRQALGGLNRYIVTAETAKHRVFQFVPAEVATEHSVVCIASSESFILGVLSSAVHERWARAAGGRLGVGNDARYQKASCFDPYPFPDPTPAQREQIGEFAERLDAHRKDALARDERVTMTGMYNVLEKLRSGEALTPKERAVHELAACGVLRDLHDALDAAVAEAYGWPWPLEREEILSRLVALHAERVAEEAAGRVRWLRPEYQMPRFGGGTEAEMPTLQLGGKITASTEHEAWPLAAWEQVLVIQGQLTRMPSTADEMAGRFKGARRDHVARHLETLQMMGEARVGPDGAYHLVPKEA